MAELILKMSSTLDGMVAGPRGEIDFLTDYADEEMDRHEVAVLWNTQAHLMGSRTFLDMQAYWPITQGPIADAMNALPKIVFSRRGLAAATTTTALEQSQSQRDAAGRKTERSPDAHTWDEATVLSGDLTTELTRLKKSGDKPLLVHGGAGFARSVLASGLVDELRLFVHPTALGTGMSIFDGLKAPLAFRTSSTACYRSGVVSIVMRRKSTP
jgi:dihydrofolate reductase